MPRTPAIVILSRTTAFISLLVSRAVSPGFGSSGRNGAASTHAAQTSHAYSLPLVLALFIHVLNRGLVNHQISFAVIAQYLDAVVHRTTQAPYLFAYKTS